MINAHATETGAVCQTRAGNFFAPVLTLTVQMRELMREFEAHKKAFHQESPEMYIELPSVLHRLTVPGRIDQGELTITKYVQLHAFNKNFLLTYESDDMRSFFDDHVDRVIELIQDHILQIEDKNSMVAVWHCDKKVVAIMLMVHRLCC